MIKWNISINFVLYNFIIDLIVSGKVSSDYILSTVLNTDKVDIRFQNIQFPFVMYLSLSTY